MNPKHDQLFGDGDGDRTSPVLAWYLQRVEVGGALAGSTLGGEPANFGHAAFANRGALVPNVGDVPALDVTPVPEPGTVALLVAGLAYLCALGGGRGRLRR